MTSLSASGLQRLTHDKLARTMPKSQRRTIRWGRVAFAAFCLAAWLAVIIVFIIK
jgi:hypothetical protein